MNIGRAVACLVAVMMAAGGVAVAQGEPANDTAAGAMDLTAFPLDVAVPLSSATLGPFEGACAPPPPPIYLPTGTYFEPDATGEVIPSAGLWYRLQLDAPSVIALALSEAAAGATLYADGDDPARFTEPRCIEREGHVALEAGNYLLVVARRAGDDAYAAHSDATMRIERSDLGAAPNSTIETASPIDLPFASEVTAFAPAASIDASCPEQIGAWYRYQPTSLQTVAVSTKALRTPRPISSFAVFEVDANANRSSRLCASSYGPMRGAFTARPTRSYLIGVGEPEALLALDVTRHPFPDAKQDAPSLIPDVTRWFSTRFATSTASEDTSCGGIRSVWFKVPPSTVPVRIDASDRDVSQLGLGLYDATGTRLGCGIDAALELQPSDEPRFLRVASSGAGGGSLVLRRADRFGQRISDRSPWEFDACGPTSISFVNSEVEVSLAASPIDPDHLVAAWQQDRTMHGGSRGLVTAASFDGGETWTTSVPSGGSVCTDGEYERATDPWVTIGADGTAYFTTLGYNGELPSDGGAVYAGSAMLVHRSGDGGITWDPPVVVAAAPGIMLHDKQAIVAHPSDPDRVYLTWSQVIGTEFSNVLACSIDGGRTWLPPVILPTGGASGVGDQLEVLDDGRLVHVLANRGPGTIQAMVSSTDGLVWSPPIILGEGTGAEGPYGIRGGNFIPDVATDGTRVFVAWTTEEGTYLASSDATVATWSRALVVPGAGRFMNSVAARNDGTVMITVLQESAIFSQQVELRVAISRDGGVSFEDQAASSRFDLSGAPYSFGRGAFLGDYAGLVATADGFYGLHPMTPSGTADLYLNRFQ